MMYTSYHTPMNIEINKCITTIAFPCVSTGVYGFPKERAARIALDVIESYLREGCYAGEVILCCFLEEDAEICQRLLTSLCG